MIRINLKRCKTCGKKLTHVKRMFCSRSCVGKWFHPRIIELGTEQCVKCLKPLENLTNGRRFCSRECYYRWKSEDWHPTSEHIQALVCSHKGKKHGPLSEEHRQAVSVGTKVAMNQPGMYEKLSAIQKVVQNKPEVIEKRRKRKYKKKYTPDEKLARDASYGVGRRLLRRAMNQFGFRKTSRTFEHLGYTPQQLREHLEGGFKPGMTWENHGYGWDKWHVDHIRPLVSFPIDTHPSVMNALENLQPLWQRENLSKRAKWVPVSDLCS